MELASATMVEKVGGLQSDIAVTGGIGKYATHCRVCDSRGLCLAEQMISDKGQLEQLSHNNRPYKSGEHLFRAGDQGSELHVIKCGSVKSYLITEEGEEQVLGFYMPGDVIGLDGCASQLHSSSAVALATTTTCRLPIAQMSEQGQGRTYPALAASQLSRDQNLVLMLARKDADGRVAGFLMDLSRRFKRIGYSE
ncbi:MAG: CRP/FNR family transcriptional regulator, partial [Gammaproteobacteria bacterium]